MKRLRALIVKAVAAALSVPISIKEGYIQQREPKEHRKRGKDKEGVDQPEQKDNA